MKGNICTYVISPKQKRAVFLELPPKRNFRSFRPQWKEVLTEFLSCWVEISFRVSCKHPLDVQRIQFIKKIFFCSFQLCPNVYIYNVVSTLTNVVKLDAENNNAVSTFSNVSNVNVEIDNVDLTLFNVAKFNVVPALFWCFITSRLILT